MRQASELRHVFAGRSLPAQSTGGIAAHLAGFGQGPDTLFTVSRAERYAELFARHRSAAIRSLWRGRGLSPFLRDQHKALSVCARSNTATAFEEALTDAKLPARSGALMATTERTNSSRLRRLATSSLPPVRRKDFPAHTCRIEIVPEVPIATSDLEEFVSSCPRGTLRQK